jgi:hypothetical protein
VQLGKRENSNAAAPATCAAAMDVPDKFPYVPLAIVERISLFQVMIVRSVDTKKN